MGKKIYDDDDGRVIAPMNVDGMPWYDKNKRSQPTGAGGGAVEPADGQVDYASMSPEEKKEYRKQTRGIIWGILLRFMPFVLAFVAVFGLFILFLTLVWR